MVYFFLLNYIVTFDGSVKGTVSAKLKVIKNDICINMSLLMTAKN